MRAVEEEEVLDENTAWKLTAKYSLSGTGQRSVSDMEEEGGEESVVFAEAKREPKMSSTTSCCSACVAASESGCVPIVDIRPNL